MNVALNSNLGALEPVSPTQFTKTVASAGTPERLKASSGTRFRMMIVMAKKTAQTNNTDKVYLGPTSGAGNQSYELSPGDMTFITMPVGTRGDFYDWWLDAAANDDGLTIIYF